MDNTQKKLAYFSKNCVLWFTKEKIEKLMLSMVYVYIFFTWVKKQYYHWVKEFEIIFILHYVFCFYMATVHF